MPCWSWRYCPFNQRIGTIMYGCISLIIDVSSEFRYTESTRKCHTHKEMLPITTDDTASLYTLKTPGSDLTRKRVGGGQTHFGVRPTRNPGQTDPESESDWPGIRVRKTFWTQIPVIFTRIPDQSDPGMGLAPWDPFPGQIWPGSF